MPIGRGWLVVLAAVAGGCVNASGDPYVLEFERAGASCASDADCDDLRACNGVEHCGTVSGQCVEGEPIVCADDGVACTDEVCVDPAGTCESRENDRNCESGFACDAARGCLGSCGGVIVEQCDPVAQCGCPTGEVCYLLGGGLTACDAPGSLTAGQRCDASTPSGDCASGLVCTRGPNGAAGPAQCREPCGTSLDCTEGVCAVTDATRGIDLCTVPCDIVANSGCISGTGCVGVLTGDFAYSTDCRVAGGATRGEPCATHADCAGGLHCVLRSSGAAECLGLCARSSDCESGESCYGFADPLTFDGEELGPCVP